MLLNTVLEQLLNIAQAVESPDYCMWLSSDVAYPEKYFQDNFPHNRKNMFDSYITISVLPSTGNSRYFCIRSYNIQY